MRTLTLVASLTLSGLVGGAAGALLVRGLDRSAGPAGDAGPAGGADAPAGRDPATAKEIESLRARLDEMQASVSSSADETARLRGDLDAERKASGEARTRLETLETSGAARGLPFLQAPAAPGEFASGSRVFMAGGDPSFQERWRRIQELRGKPEEERWTAAREALGLTLGQEEELKAALKEREQAMRDAMKLETAEVKGGDGAAEGAVTIRMPDLEKVREARRKYDDRVASALNVEQAKKWKEDGYEQALGSGGMGFGGAAIRVESIPADRK
jgi:hypothetical protein